MKTCLNVVFKILFNNFDIFSIIIETDLRLVDERCVTSLLGKLTKIDHRYYIICS